MLRVCKISKMRGSLRKERNGIGKMKKLSIIMATVCTLVCLLCISASAANEITVSGAVETTTQSTEFAYKVSFSENTGFNTLGIKLTYPEGFEYVGADASTLIKDAFYLDFAGYAGETYVFHHDAAARTVTFVGASLYNVTAASGDLFEITFTAPATAGTYDFTLELVDTAYEEAGKVVSVDKVNGTVTVEEGSTYALGDVNMDGKINAVDAIRILRYDAGLETLTDAQLVLANVAGFNNTVNAADAIKILRYDAGLDTIE